MWLVTSARCSSTLPVTVQYCTYLQYDFRWNPYSSTNGSTGSFRSPVLFKSCLGADEKAGHNRSLRRHFHFTARVIFLCLYHARKCIVIKCPTNLTSVLEVSLTNYSDICQDDNNDPASSFHSRKVAIYVEALKRKGTLDDSGRFVINQIFMLLLVSGGWCLVFMSDGLGVCIRCSFLTSFPVIQ
jgi:hypothetical protein